MGRNDVKYRATELQLEANFRELDTVFIRPRIYHVTRVFVNLILSPQ